MCFKALESSNYEVRMAVAQLFAILFSMTQEGQKGGGTGTKMTIFFEFINSLQMFFNYRTVLLV